MNEAEYICFLAKDISRELYQRGGYYVLPKLIKDPNTVFFPDLCYTPSFWRAIEQSKACNLGDTYPKEAVIDVTSKLKKNKDSRTIKRDGLEVELLITEFGTRGSYYVKGSKIYMTQRTGNTKKDFERTLLMAEMKIKNKDNAEIGSINWHRRMAVGDYFYETNKSKLSAETIKASNEYLKKLGFYKNDFINKINYKDFTHQEENLTKNLILAKGEIVSFDQTAQILWGENSYEKYSLEAMAKVIENIRKKIKEQRVMNEVIFTKRGKGYFIQN